MVGDRKSFVFQLKVFRGLFLFARLSFSVFTDRWMLHPASVMTTNITGITAPFFSSSLRSAVLL